MVAPYAIRRRGARGDILHWIDPLSFSAAPNAARVPQVVMVHHLTEPEIEPMLRRLKHADGLVTSSRRWQRRLSEMTGSRVDLIPYTVDAEVFRPLADVGTARAELGIRSGEFVIGYSGKAAADAHGRKGIDILTELIAASAKRWGDLAILLIGAGWNELARAIEMMGVRVIRYEPGSTEETARVYPLMDVLVSTSREEGGPCTIMEAMACGVPAITTDVGHVPELIVDGENGFVCSWSSPVAEFVDRIGILRGDADLRARLIRNGRRTIVEHRDPRVVIPRIDFARIYDEARRRYARRPAHEIVTRTAALSTLGLRHLARRTQRTLARLAR